MAYLNQQERDNLLNELKSMSYDSARWKIRGLDSKVRLAFYRNNQEAERWLTRYVLPSLGTRVTLVESNKTTSKKGKLHSEYNLVEVIVEPTPENRT